MDTSWIQVASFWVSISMAVIAIASSMIAFRIYRSSTDPNVIVYADLDDQRPSIVVIIIENVGQGPARDIQFETSRPLPEDAMGFENAPMPREMTASCLISGIPYLAPRQRFVLTWGQYGGLHKFLGDSTVTVTAHYSRANESWMNRRLHGSSMISIGAMAQLDASDHNWGRNAAHHSSD